MSKRAKMLASTIREHIAPVLRSCPSDCGIVSITDVEVSEDFSYATVYISALEHPEKALSHMDRRTFELQKSLSDLHRKHIPLLRFRIDPRGERGGRIEELLDSLS